MSAQSQENSAPQYCCCQSKVLSSYSTLWFDAAKVTNNSIRTNKINQQYSK
jgi:hypothetical protein